MEIGMKFRFVWIHVCFVLAVISHCKSDDDSDDTMNNSSSDSDSSITSITSSDSSLSVTTTTTTTSDSNSSITLATSSDSSSPIISNTSSDSSSPIISTTSSDSSSSIISTSSSNISTISRTTDEPSLNSTTLPTSTPPSSNNLQATRLQSNCNCEKTSLICTLLIVLLMIGACILACILYLVYLKRLEIHLRSCRCQIEQKDVPMNRTVDDDNDDVIFKKPKVGIDTIRSSELCSKYNISISAADLNTISVNVDEATKYDTFAGIGRKKNKFRLKETKKFLDTKNEKNEIASWNVYKYLEFLKKEKEHEYEVPKICHGPVYDTPRIYANEASTSK